MNHPGRPVGKPEQNDGLPAGHWPDLFTELVAGAQLLTREIEAAKDLAGECLLAVLEQPGAIRMVDLPAVYEAAKQLLKAVYLLFCAEKEARSVAESIHQYILQEPSLPLHRFVGELEASLLQLTVLLTAPERQVIELNLVYGYDLKTIAQLTGKPVSTIRIVRNRAAVYLEKLAALQLKI